jgi:hypothetical protein
MLPNYVPEIYPLYEELEKHLFFLCTFHYDIWYNFGGVAHPRVISFLKYRKEQQAL